MASSEELQKWISLEKEATRAKTNEMILIVIIKTLRIVVLKAASPRTVCRT